MPRARELAVVLFLFPALAAGQQPNAPPAVVAGIPVNYDEGKVGTYTLPDPLVLANGQRVRDAKTWREKRRPEIVTYFEEIQYGRAPGRPSDVRAEVHEAGASALDGAAVRRQVTIHFTKDSAGPKAELLMYLPANARGKVPLLLQIGFGANAATVADSGVRLGEVWGRDGKKVAATRGRPGPGRLDPRPFLAEGIGVATVYYGDIEPDFKDGLAHGIRSRYLKPGQTAPAPDEWGAIAAWAWGLSRVMDYLETDRGVDAGKVALVGVSRLGKTVLWAGARDTRFAMVIASCSGESGAAISRRDYGETVAHMTHPTRYGYQFAAHYATYGARVGELPMDGHMLVSLIAPRPVLLQTGDTDGWSDPKGEFVAAVAATPVFELLGKKGLSTTEMPAAGQPLLDGTLGYYMHAGGHGTIPSDWPIFLAFMKKHLPK